jgi:flagellar operon protein
VTSAVPNAALVPPGPAATPATTTAATAGGTAATLSGPTFGDVLARSTSSPAAVSAPQFSRHALERVNRRGIQLDQSTLQRLSGGMARAASKGSRDAVVFVDSTAFVVSVPNNTVITAVDSEHMREHVFTNIDSAVIA